MCLFWFCQHSFAHLLNEDRSIVIIFCIIEKPGAEKFSLSLSHWPAAACDGSKSERTRAREREREREMQMRNLYAVRGRVQAGKFHR